MKQLKILITVLIFTFNLNAYSLFEEFETKISEVKGNTIYFDMLPNIRLGASGVVVKVINEDSSFIISNFIITKITKDKVIAKISEFKALKHTSFPSLDIKPQVGDKLVVNYLYHRILPIVPNSKVLQDIKEKFADVTFVHPDILSAELVKSSDESPAYENFERTCRNVVSNLLFFAIKDIGYFVDCKSFKILDQIDIKDYKEIKLPYYTRIKDLDSGLLGFGNDKIENYSAYYNSLLKEKNRAFVNSGGDDNIEESEPNYIQKIWRSLTGR